MTLDEQKAVKPTYRQLSESLLHGEMKNTMDELVGILGSLRLKPNWYATNSYNVKFKGKMIFRFNMNDSNQVALFFTVADKASLDGVLSGLTEELKAYYFEHLRICTKCNPSHSGREFIILGDPYLCCAEPEMRIDNPTKKAIVYITEFIRVRKDNIGGKKIEK